MYIVYVTDKIYVVNYSYINVPGLLKYYSYVIQYINFKKQKIIFITIYTV